MISRPLIRRLFGTTVVAAMASLWLAGCMAGTGTDTENGIQVTAQVVGTNGAPLAKVEVKVQSLNAGPESQSEDPLMPGTGTLHTDSAGFVTFKVKRTGRYMAQGQRGDSVLILDTLRAKANDTSVFRTRGVQRLRGKVRLYSGYQIDTGFVFLRGSSITVPVSRTGNYDFGYVPVSAESLTLGAHYSARPASRVFVKMANAGGALVIDSRFSLDSDLMPVSGANLTLLKASESATNVCLESTLQSVVAGVSIRGSLEKTADVMRAASFACSQRVGAAIQVDAANIISGASLQKLGDYVLPDVSIWPQEYKMSHGLGSGATGQKIVVPANCLQTGTTTNFAASVTKVAGSADIRVDDISLASGCEY